MEFKKRLYIAVKKKKHFQLRFEKELVLVVVGGTET